MKKYLSVLILLLISVFLNFIVAMADSINQKYLDQLNSAKEIYTNAMLKNYSTEKLNSARRAYLLALKDYNDYKKYLNNINKESDLTVRLEKKVIKESDNIVNSYSFGIKDYMIHGPSKEEILKNKYGYIDANMVNIRTGPGVSNTKISCLPRNSNFIVLDYSKGWYKVRFSNGLTGWIAGWLVRTVKEPSLKPVSTGALFGRFIETGRVTSEYGWRIHPIYKTKKFHNGIDIGAPKGTPVLSIGAGTVIYADWSDGYGRLVKVKYDNGYTCYYAHLDDYAGMTSGKRVLPGQIVGKVNSSGLSTGHHLHFEVRTSDGKPVNPRSIPGIII